MASFFSNYFCTNGAHKERKLNYIKMNKFIRFLANSQPAFINLIRISICIVMAWIGGLKAFQYEADGIVPFVANSPLMSFFIQKMRPNTRIIKIPKGRPFKKI